MRKITGLAIVAVLLTLFLAACGGDGDSSDQQSEAETQAMASGDAEAGEEHYQSTCAACHGPDAKGLPNLGKDLTASEFVSTSSQAELLAFIKEGRPVGHPENTTGIDMPPKGGNPALTDEQIVDIIAYLRTLEE
ncbi:MAG: cytochrome c [Candidatus Promineifilaceae bacterium]|nr:cytochrome c [Candidatus Promineifilaceae bacterium]